MVVSGPAQALLVKVFEGVAKGAATTADAKTAKVAKYCIVLMCALLERFVDGLGKCSCVVVRYGYCGCLSWCMDLLTAQATVSIHSKHSVQGEFEICPFESKSNQLAIFSDSTMLRMYHESSISSTR